MDHIAAATSNLSVPATDKKTISKSESPDADFQSLVQTFVDRQSRMKLKLDAWEGSRQVSSQLRDTFGPADQVNQAWDGLLSWMTSSVQPLFNDFFDSVLSQDQAFARGSILELSSFQMSMQSSVSTASLATNQGGGEVTSVNAMASFAEMRMEMRMEVMRTESVAEVEEDQKLGQGGNMIEVSGRYMSIQSFIKLMDPVVLDLAGDGIDLSGIEDGVSYDLAGDGKKVQTGFVRGDDAFLYLDTDGDGLASDGRELFGDQEGHAHGFAKLADYDSNGDGLLDRDDASFRALRVWNDWNANGINEIEESRSLDDAGVESLSLDYTDTHEVDAHGNVITQVSHFDRVGGGQGLLADAALAYRDYV